MQKFITLSGLLMLSACANEAIKNERPDWLDKPENNLAGQCVAPEKDTISQQQGAFKQFSLCVDKEKH
ncbi:MAG: hypothetical protein KAT90_04300 [Gammaproteobacteria bacterium]|nr:hypothetical protein [Gammaproteobacteria bacterium]